MHLHAACLVNICEGKDAGVIFRLNHSIHQHTSIGCDIISWCIVGTIFNLAKINKHSSFACVQPLSLFRTASRQLDSLACIESITDAYS